jgi:hypothetical protein
MSAHHLSLTSLSHHVSGARALRCLALAAALAGCGEADTSADDTADAGTGAPAGGTGCGFTFHGNHESVQALLDALPACELAAPSERIDLAAGCVDGICADMTYAEIVEATGAEGACRPSEYEGETDSLCLWATGGVVTIHDDADADGEPDPDDATSLVFVHAGADATDPRGLGVGMSLRCYLDELGAPDSVQYCATDGVRRIVSLQYMERGIGAWSLLPENRAAGSVDQISLAGPR